MNSAANQPLLNSDDLVEKLTHFLSEQTHSAVAIESIKILSGGAIQENRLVVVDVNEGDYQGRHEWVVRSDADTVIGESLSRYQEYLLLSYAFDNNIKVAKPLWYGDHSVFGHAFFVMEKANGITRPAHLTNEARFNTDRVALTASLGEQLALIHGLNDHESLAFLHRPDEHPAAFWLKQYKTYLNKLDEYYPILDLTIRQLMLHLPSIDQLAINHRDFRTGNLMVDEHGLTAILDWEFCAWSDPHEDIAWFCAPCWRFANRSQEAGGIGERHAFYHAYEKTSGRKINHESVKFWEMFATLRWAMIAIEQGYRHLSNEPSLELALTAHIVPELEHDLLTMLKEAA